MRSTADDLEVLGMMAAHELAIADLYRVYSERFSHYRDFFSGLAAEEQRHARHITRFVSDIRKGTASIQSRRFDQQSILESLDLIQRYLQEASRKDFTVYEALSVSASLEDTLIEQGFFAISVDDAPALQDLLRTLAGQTEQHRQQVHAALEKERGVPT